MANRETAFFDNGFVIDRKICAYLTGYFARHDDFPADMVETAKRPDFFKSAEEERLGEEFYRMDWLNERLEDEGVQVLHCSEFTGEASTIAEMLSGKPWNPVCLEYDDKYLLMIPLERAPDLFHRAYRDAEEVIQEIDEVFKKFPGAFPEGFDISRYICEVIGTDFS